MYNSNVSILVTCAIYLPIDSVKELNNRIKTSSQN